MSPKGWKLHAEMKLLRDAISFLMRETKSRKTLRGKAERDMRRRNYSFVIAIEKRTVSLGSSRIHYRDYFRRRRYRRVRGREERITDARLLHSWFACARYTLSLSRGCSFNSPHYLRVIRTYPRINSTSFFTSRRGVLLHFIKIMRDAKKKRYS